MSFLFPFIFVYRQLFVPLPYPTASFAGQTVIVTGSNVGLGREAARHITRLGAATVILAVRSIEKGEEAARDIEQSTHTKGVVQVWELDMANYASVQAFAARVDKELPRLDVALLNAGVATSSWRMAEDNELTITVNVVSTMLLALLLLPKLKATSNKFNRRPNLTIVSSGIHFTTDLPERSAPEGKLFETLAAKEKADMPQRYPVSKILEIFAVREIAAQHPAERFPVTVNLVDPGLCHSELARESNWGVAVLKFLLARSTEYGSRTLVSGACFSPESHGAYLGDCIIRDTSPFVQSAEGAKTQRRVWEELSQKLEKISPGVLGNL